MSRAEYLVLQDGLQWKVRLNGEDCAFETQSDAMTAAIDAANAAGRAGLDAQVLVQGHSGHWRSEWTYGRDLYSAKYQSTSLASRTSAL
jgi:hypothetical protein